MLNFFVFFIVYYLSFLSICSYGKHFRLIFFKHANNDVNFNNEFGNFFFGVAFFIIFSWLYNFSFGLKNEWINLMIFIIGLICFILDKNKTNNKIFYFLPVFLFSGILVYNNHNDFHLYHFQNIIELIDNNPKIGIGNLNPKYVYASFFIYFESLFHFPIYQYEFTNVPRYLVFVSICGYLLFNVLERNKFNQFLSAVLLIFFLLKFKRFSEHGYDYIVTFFIIFIFLEFFYTNKKKIYHLKSMLFFFAILVCIKVTGLFFLPFIIYAICKNYLIIFSEKSWSKNLIPTFIVLFIFIMNSFLNSGCILYPLKSSCFNQNLISWSVNYNYIEKESDVAKQWAKGFYHQDKSNKELSYEKFLKNGKWIPSWFQSHFKNKIFEPILIFISTVLIYYFLSRSKKEKEKKNSLKIFILSFISLIFWFFSLPQLRFGYSFVLIYIFLLFSFFLKNENALNKRCKIFILLAIVFFNYYNINRIFDEFSQNINFPFYQTLSYKTQMNRTNDVAYQTYIRGKSNIRVIDEKKNLLLKYNLSFFEDNLNYYKKYNFIIIEQLH